MPVNPEGRAKLSLGPLWDVEREEMGRPGLSDLWLTETWCVYTDEKLQETHKGANGSTGTCLTVQASVGSLLLVPKYNYVASLELKECNVEYWGWKTPLGTSED